MDVGLVNLHLKVSCNIITFVIPPTASSTSKSSCEKKADLSGSDTKAFPSASRVAFSFTCTVVFKHLHLNLLIARPLQTDNDLFPQVIPDVSNQETAFSRHPISVNFLTQFFFSVSSSTRSCDKVP